MFDWEGLFAAIGFIVFVLIGAVALTELFHRTIGRYF